MFYGQKYVVKTEPTNPTKSYNIVIMQCISIKWKQRITEMKQCTKVINKKKKKETNKNRIKNRTISLQIFLCILQYLSHCMENFIVN